MWTCHNRSAKQNLLVKPAELEARSARSAQMGSDGRILVLLDTDEDCPAELGPELLARAQQEREDRKIAVVLAKADYEAWFVAAAPSLVGSGGLMPNVTVPPDVEALGNPKGRISVRMQGRRYRETTHQPALTSRFDLAMPARLRHRSTRCAVRSPHCSTEGRAS